MFKHRAYLHKTSPFRNYENKEEPSETHLQYRIIDYINLHYRICKNSLLQYCASHNIYFDCVHNNYRTFCTPSINVYSPNAKSVAEVKMKETSLVCIGSSEKDYSVKDPVELPI